MKKVISAVVAVLALPAAAHAQAGPSASASASASAEIVQPLSINCTSMDFGKLAPLQTASATVVLPAQGTPIVDADNIVVPGTRSNAQPSNCTVMGQYNLTYAVTLPTSTNLSNGSATMALNNFTISTQLDPNPLDRQLATAIGGGTGLDGFGVGATLNVGAAQAPGLYTGTFAVQVQYN